MPTRPEPSSMTYLDAIAELDDILARLDADDVDIDELANHVERAAALIRSCQARIVGARTNVERVVAELTNPVPDPDRAQR